MDITESLVYDAADQMLSASLVPSVQAIAKRLSSDVATIAPYFSQWVSQREQQEAQRVQEMQASLQQSQQQRGREYLA